ncbi:MAG: histidine kinase [Prevotella sp.]|nr:histidine kinase [Prevotella sp.]
MSFRKEKRLETLIYLGLWTLLFLIPVVSMFIRVSETDTTFSWSNVFVVWKEFLPFFIVFLIHNHLMAPLLVYQQKRSLYFALSALLVIIFLTYQCNSRPAFDDRGPMHHERMADGNRPPQPPDHRYGDFSKDEEFAPEGGPQEFFEDMTDSVSPLNDSTVIAQYDPKDYQRRPFRGPRDDKRPPLFTGQHDILSCIVMLMMLVMNLGIKLYFKHYRDRQQLEELEKENMKQQLEYLKYQINPHFFMNTLNNIHALVDIDPEQAKSTIIDLSKLMRYVLYESNKQLVPIQKEMEFMDNYVRLMRIRYTEKLKFSVKEPINTEGVMVPPLLFISFVENAFKHGVSYQHDSFISVECEHCKNSRGEDRLYWSCRNSKNAKKETTSTGLPRQGGIGLENVRRRLDILYGNRYTLENSETETEYIVRMDIPLDA